MEGSLWGFAAAFHSSKRKCEGAVTKITTKAIKMDQRSAMGLKQRKTEMTVRR